jgi:predicted glycosyltransferase
VEESELDEARLAAAIERALAQPRPSAADIDLDGARASARLVREWLS